MFDRTLALAITVGAFIAVAFLYTLRLQFALLKPFLGWTSRGYRRLCGERPGRPGDLEMKAKPTDR